MVGKMEALFWGARSDGIVLSLGRAKNKATPAVGMRALGLCGGGATQGKAPGECVVRWLRIAPPSAMQSLATGAALAEVRPAHSWLYEAASDSLAKTAAARGVCKTAANKGKQRAFRQLAV